MNSWDAFSYLKKVNGVSEWRDEAEKQYYKDLITHMSPEDFSEGLAEYEAVYGKISF